MTNRFGKCGSLADLFVRTCGWKGRHTIFADDQDRQFSGDVALNQASRFASALRAAGAERGDVVAFLCLGSAPHAVAWFGAIMGGYVTSNLHVRIDSVDQVAQTLEWLDAKFVVHDVAFAELIQAAVQKSGLGTRTLALDDGVDGWAAFVNTAEPMDYQGERPEPSSLASIVLSSGSTGQPKGVMHSQATLLAGALSGQGMLEGLHKKDTVMLAMNPSFAAWLMFVLAAIAGRSRLFFVRRYEPATVMELIERERVTVFPSVPTMWRMAFAIDTEDRDLTSLRLIGVGGETLTADDVTRMTTQFCKRLAGGYMASESANGCAVMVYAEDLADGKKIGSTGQPVAGADVRIVDPEGSIDDLLQSGQTGEIVVTGSSVGLGYWREPELTAKKFVDGWWRSGDLGHLDEDGYLWINGRVDNVINTGGIKVHAEEIEAQVLTHPGVSACAVVGHRDEHFGQRIVAYVVLKGAGVTPDDLKVHLKEHCQMSGYKVPKAIHILDALPTGLTGKLDRRALRNVSE